jgi:hypothetical protein
MIAVEAILFHSTAGFSVGCPRADVERPPTATAAASSTEAAMPVISRVCMR